MLEVLCELDAVLWVVFQQIYRDLVGTTKLVSMRTEYTCSYYTNNKEHREKRKIERNIRNFTTNRYFTSDDR